MQQRETKAIRKRTFAELSASHSEPSFLSRAGDYLFGRKLASSGNSEVYIAVHPKTGQDVVCKVLKRLSPTTQRIEGDAGSRTNVKSPGPRRKEGKIHTQLHHPHILPLVDVFEATDRVCIVTKYARGGTLDTYVRQRQQGEGCGLPIEEAWRLFSQLVSAVAYLHASGFAHRDIKPDNILLDENGNVLLADFGLSCKFAQGRVKDKACGTVGFLAPCLLQDEVSYIGPELDCWALGMCLFFMLTGRNPFGSTSPLKMSKKVRLGRYQWRKGEPQGLVRDLVAKLLQIDVSGRATIDQVLNHPWITIRPEPTSARLPRRMSDLPTKVRKFKSAEGLSYKRLHTCELRSSPLSSISE